MQETSIMQNDSVMKVGTAGEITNLKNGLHEFLFSLWQHAGISLCIGFKVSLLTDFIQG